MLRLVIGNKNYSSWSMRPWLVLKHFGLEFEEIRIPLFTDTYEEELRQHSPTLRVPVLKDGDLVIWDSLAICEYVSEKFLQGTALPQDQVLRAQCRSYCAEMHSGFAVLRSQLPMNCRARRMLQTDAEIEAEVARIDTLWQQARNSHTAPEPYLFGAFSMADAFFAPVVMRFLTYGITVSAESADYMQVIVENAAVSQWLEEANSESEIIAAAELGDPIES